VDVESGIMNEDDGTLEGIPFWSSARLLTEKYF
jgi:hypothetical protein